MEKRLILPDGTQGGFNPLFSRDLVSTLQGICTGLRRYLQVFKAYKIRVLYKAYPYYAQSISLYF